MDYKKQISNYTTLPNVEIEIRLGSINVYNKNKFDSSIDKLYFEKILKNLEQFNEWKYTYVMNTVEYLKNNLRTIEYENGYDLNIVKEKIYKQDYQLKNVPFDIRFSINQELVTPESVNKEDSLIRKKSRKTFQADNFKYDLTYVTEIKNNIPKDKYEIEVELIINKDTLEWSDKYINDFLICKIQDIVNILDENDSKIPESLLFINNS
jgi:hypothetical protein